MPPSEPEDPPPPCPTPFRTLYCRNPYCKHDLMPVYLDDSRKTFVVVDGKRKEFHRLMCGMCGMWRIFETVYLPPDLTR